MPNLILTLNPKVFLIGSSIEQAKQIEELITLYGDNWSTIYKEIVAKKRLENIYTKEISKEICKGGTDNVCS